MNYSQEIEQIEKTFRETYFTIPSVEELLTLAKKMQEEREGNIRALEAFNEKLFTYQFNWIPCSERLPQKAGEYLVTIEVDGLSDVWKVWWFEENNEWGAYKISAWKPLPEPFKS